MLEERGPYSTFSRKITAGHALRLYDDAFQANLDIIRTIRNAFAHSKRVIDFSHPLVTAQLERIVVPNFKKKRFREIKKLADGLSTYRSLCILSATWLITRRTKSMNASIKRPRKPKNYLSFYNALVPSLNLADLGKSQEGGIKSNQLLIPLSQSVGPSSPTHGGLLAGMFSPQGLTLAELGKLDKK